MGELVSVCDLYLIGMVVLSVVMMLCGSECDLEGWE